MPSPPWMRTRTSHLLLYHPSPGSLHVRMPGTQQCHPVRCTHSLLLQPDLVTGEYKKVFYCLVATASDALCSLQAGVSVERHLSRIFPAHPRSLASVLTPRPATLRCSASATPPYGSGFPNKNLPRKMRAAAAQSAGEIFLRSLRRKHISALGAGHLASLRAGVSRGQSGQIQTGEMTWHSTKTTSS